MNSWKSLLCTAHLIVPPISTNISGFISTHTWYCVHQLYKFMCKYCLKLSGTPLTQNLCSQTFKFMLSGFCVIHHLLQKNKASGTWNQFCVIRVLYLQSLFWQGSIVILLISALFSHYNQVAIDINGISQLHIHAAGLALYGCISTPLYT